MDTNLVKDIYPLSSTQEGMLYHSLYAPDSGVYLVQLQFKIFGQIDISCFDQAWQLLINRHDILRTAFAWDNLEQPLQVVVKKARLEVERIDLTDKDSQIQHDTLTKLLKSDRNNGFNLSKGPLIRVYCLQLSAQENTILCTYHHILMDGWSLPLLLKDWYSCYEHALAGKTPSDYSGQYGEYIRWRKQQDSQIAKDYWQRHMKQLTEPCLLAHITSDNKPAKVSTLYQNIDLDTTSCLETLARECQTTMSCVIQAAWTILLSRYTANNAIIFGVTRSGRPPQLQHNQEMIGMFINTLPIIYEIKNSDTIRDIIFTMHKLASEHQAYEYLGQSELPDINHQSVGMMFDSIVIFENYPAPAKPKSSSINIADVQVHEETHYPVNLFATHSHSLAIKLMYDENLLPSDFADAQLKRVCHLLTIFTEQQDSLVTQIDIRTDEDLKFLKKNNPPVIEQNYPPLHEAILAQALRTPDAVALKDDDATYDYQTLSTYTNILAQHLLLHNIKQGSRVAVCMDRSAALIIVLLGILRTGASYIPLDKDLPDQRLQYILSDCEADLLISDTSSLESTKLWQGRHLNIPAMKDILSLAQSEEPIKLSDHNELTAYSIYTSGSTGKPKGVNITHKSLMNLLLCLKDKFNITSSDNLLALTTLSFDIAALEIFLPLLTGATVTIAKSNDVRNPDQLNLKLVENEITFMQATPSSWKLLKENDWHGKSDLQILSGGEALDIELAQYLTQHCKKLWNVYGPTETTIWSSAYEVKPEAIEKWKGICPIGGAVANTTLHAIDKQDQELPVGMIGELAISGMGVGIGYHARETLTQEKFFEHPIWGRTFRTGDLVRLRSNGLFDYLGRIDDQIKLRGHRIELGEIESVLQQHPSIQQAAVVLNERQSLIAYVISSDDEELAWREHLQAQLPQIMWPTKIHKIDSFPLNANGKLDRNAIQNIKVKTQPESFAPTNSLQEEIRSLWIELLDNPSIDIHDHFFEVGGHSLLVLKAQSLLKTKLQIEISLAELFQYPTIASLAQYIHIHQQKNDLAEDTLVKSVQPHQSRQRLSQRRQHIQS
ncbi:MAG: amino acid adenylation domain-containing protein [Pseudomonadota bacterium]